MPREYTLAPRLKLILNHVKAVRTLDEYVTGVGMKRDMQELANYLQQDISSKVLRPAGWEDLRVSKAVLYSSPKATSPENQLVQKWCVVEDQAIAIAIYPAWPVQDDEEPYVELYVPKDWEKRQRFIGKLKPPPEFEHASQYSRGELDESTSVFKYIRYENHLGPDGEFNAVSFIEAFREATKAVVAMEREVDRILERLR